MTMANIIVKAKVTSANAPKGASQGVIGVAGIVKKPQVGGKLIKVTSFDELLRKAGGYMLESTVVYGLEKIFKKLGKAEVYIAPVTHRSDVSDPLTETGKPAKVVVSDVGATADIVEAESIFLGKEGEKWAVEIKNVNDGDKTYDVALLYADTAVKSFTGVKNTTFMDTVSHPDIMFTMLVNDDDTLPEAKKYPLADGVDAHADVAIADYDTAIAKLKKLPLDFLIVDSTNITNIQTAVSQAEQMKAHAFVNTPYGMSDENAIAFRANFNSAFGELFHPHQYENDPIGSVNKPNRPIPIAYEAVANTILAHKAIGRRQVGAGQIFGGLTGLGLTQEVDGELLSETGVNFAIEFENDGTYLWDAMTLSKDPDWGDANRAHLFSYIYKTLTPALRPDLFKASDEDLWEAIRTRLNIPMRNLFKAKELYSEDGSTSSAYFIHCDETNNTREDQKEKKTNVRVGYKDKHMVKWIELQLEIS